MTEEKYPEYVLNYIATERLISEKESELGDLYVEVAKQENRLEYLLDMVIKANEIGKEIRYLDRQIDETDNYLLDLSIKLQEETEEHTKLQNDLDKYLQEIKEAGWEQIYIWEGDRQSIKWVKNKNEDINPDLSVL
jgi:hypothetical protein